MPSAVSGAQTKPSYTASPDGKTVTDNVTMLIWQRSLPQTYDGCSGKYASDGVAGDACVWEDAKNHCASSARAAALGGSGWRLPTKIELESIVDETRFNPTIDPIFANTPAKVFWTASPSVSSAASAWRVYFLNGVSSYGGASVAYSVRCVR